MSPAHAPGCRVPDQRRGGHAGLRRARCAGGGRAGVERQVPAGRRGHAAVPRVAGQDPERAWCATGATGHPRDGSPGAMCPSRPLCLAAAAGDLALASKHYVQAEAPEPCVARRALVPPSTSLTAARRHAKAVASWVQRAYPSEEPYFVLREVLRCVCKRVRVCLPATHFATSCACVCARRYLTRGNLRDANEFHKAYRAARPHATWDAPVMRFSEFLLATLQVRGRAWRQCRPRTRRPSPSHCGLPRTA